MNSLLLKKPVDNSREQPLINLQYFQFCCKSESLYLSIRSAFETAHSCWCSHWSLLLHLHAWRKKKSSDLGGLLKAVEWLPAGNLLFEVWLSEELSMSLSFPSNCHYFHFICVPEFYPADCFIVIALWTVPDHCCLLVNSPIRMAVF